jgi:hypothetical protein
MNHSTTYPYRRTLANSVPLLCEPIDAKPYASASDGRTDSAAEPKRWTRRLFATESSTSLVADETTGSTGDEESSPDRIVLREVVLFSQTVLR